VRDGGREEKRLLWEMFYAIEGGIYLFAIEVGVAVVRG